jgi:flavin-dependent dehydrogenase
MGGGPAGATLGTMLVKDMDFKVAIFEKEVFPREHIGESFAHTMIPTLEQSGALKKVMDSDCWVKKFGGAVFNWGESPMVAFFDQPNVKKDNTYRYSIHVNRSEFDDILLKHAAEVGVEVFENSAIIDFQSDKNGCKIRLKDDTEVTSSFFVDASGRKNSIVTKKNREWLSDYRNIAIWQHFVDCKPIQKLDGKWNTFAKEDLSFIGCFAFQDGWCWYIPVPKIINGERKITHSIGIVTIPEILEREGCNFRDQKMFIKAIRSVPYLSDLIKDAKPVLDEMNTAANYSMINHQFANFDERWMLVGDAAYFVDPLFSSGAGFSTNMAINAATVIRATLSESLDQKTVEALWEDYDDGWHGMAENFALAIDQWYHALGRDNSESIYWKHRDGSKDLNIRERTFDVLINTAVTAHVLQAIVDKPIEGMDSPVNMDKQGAEKSVDVPDFESVHSSVVPELARGVKILRSYALDVPGFKGFLPAAPFDRDVDELVKEATAKYWSDPIENSDSVVGPVSKPVPCYRFFIEINGEKFQVRGLQRDGVTEILECLQKGLTMGELESALTITQLYFLKRLISKGIVEVNEIFEVEASEAS